MIFKDYVTSILYIAFFAIILELFLPKTKLKKYISGIVSLLIILTIMTPVFDAFKDGDFEKVIDDAIYAISSNTEESVASSIDFSKYQNKIILSRVKDNLETQLLTEFSDKLKDVAVVKSVEISLSEEYKINEVVVGIESGNLNTAKIILDRLITEYNIPNDMLKLKEMRY